MVKNALDQLREIGFKFDLHSDGKLTYTAENVSSLNESAAKSLLAIVAANKSLAIDIILAQMEVAGEEKAVADPRPDLAAELNDGKLWARLLRLAYRQNGDIYVNLRAIRTLGATLKLNARGDGYVLRPIIGRSRSEGIEWASEAEYKATVQKHLDPHKNAVVSLLASLAGIGEENEVKINEVSERKGEENELDGRRLADYGAGTRLELDFNGSVLPQSRPQK